MKITDRSFRYASPRLRNQLPDSFRQPRQSCLDSPPHPLVNTSLSSSPLSSSITPLLSLQAQNLAFQQILTLDFFYVLDAFVIIGLDRTYHAHHFIFSFTFYFLFIPSGRLSWLTISFLLHVKYTLPYRIVNTKLNANIQYEGNYERETNEMGCNLTLVISISSSVRINYRHS